MRIDEGVNGDDALRHALNGQLAFSVGGRDLLCDTEDEGNITYIHRRYMVLDEISLTDDSNNEYAKIVAVSGQYAARGLSSSVIDGPGRRELHKAVRRLEDAADVVRWKCKGHQDAEAIRRKASLRQQARSLRCQFGL